MSRIRLPVPSFTGGVSQQQPHHRLPSQQEACENVSLDPTRGAIKRQPTRHVAAVTPDTNQPIPAALHPIERDGTEKYLVLLHHRYLRVFDTEGNSIPVHGPTSPYTPDFSYLSIPDRVFNLFPDSEEPSDWAYNSAAIAPTKVLETHPLLPGVEVLRMGTTPPTDGAAQYTLGASNSYPINSNYILSVYVKPETVTDVKLLFTNTVSATFDFSASPITITNGADGTGSLEDLGNGWYRISLRSKVSTTGAVKITFQTNGAGDKTALVWGAAVHTDGILHDFLDPATSLRPLTVQDFTFITNPRKPVLADSNTTPAELTPGQALTADEDAFLFIRQAADKTTFQLYLNHAGTTRVLEVFTDSGLSNPTPPAFTNGIYQVTTNGVRTDEIAIQFVNIINAFNGPGQVFAGITATRRGSVVRFTNTAAGPVGEAYREFRAADGLGDSAVIAIHKSVVTFSDLPTVCLDGFKVRVQGDPENGEDDDYYVVFVADNPSASGGFTDGHWEETIGFDVSLGLDADTMPHQLVRKVDDGTVTGVSGQVYFDFAPAPCTQREVGDATSNPDPSFVGTASAPRYISDIFFYRGRLGMLTGESMVMSGANDFFTFYRTTVRTLLDADRIDVSASSTDVVTLRSVALLADRLVAISDRAQFVLTFDAALTPSTAALPPLLGERVISRVRPATVGTSIFMPREQGNSFMGITEVLGLDSSQGVQINDATLQVPRYLVPQPRRMVGDSNTLFLLDAQRKRIHVFRITGTATQRAQAAWASFVLNDDVEDIGRLGTDIWLLCHRPGKLTLERMPIDPATVDTPGWAVYLDRRLTQDDVTEVYDAGSDTTTITVPFQYTGTLLAVKASTGLAYNVLSRTDTDLVVSGDVTGEDYYVGELYTARVQVTEPVLRQQNQDGVVPLLDGRFSVSVFRLAFGPSGAFKAQVTIPGESPYVHEWTHESIGDTLEVVTLDSGTFDVGVGSLSDEATVELLNDTALPSTWTSAAWIGNYAPNSTPL